MKLPRDLSGDELAVLLRRQFGYRIARQKGTHMRLTVVAQGAEHGVTIPRHDHIVWAL